jgi:hypothetical protein
MNEFEIILRAELRKLNELQAEIIRSESPNFYPGTNPALWKRSDGTYILMPVIEARSSLLLAIAFERSRGKN